MPLMDPLQRNLADLPEELIELTLRSIICQSSLAAAALTSRQLHRIAQPILTESVPIFASDDGRPLKQYNNRRRFQQALTEQPDLASSVKTLKLFSHFDIVTVDVLGWLRVADAAADGRYAPGEVESTCSLLNSLRHLKILDASEYVERYSSNSSIMQTIDLWLYRFCEDYTPIFDWTNFTAPPPTCFTWLKVLHVSVIPQCLDPPFRPPKLEHLGLHHLIPEANSAIRSWWSTIEDCPIKILPLTNLRLESWPEEDGNLLYEMATVLEHLQTLDITAVNRGHATLALKAFKQRIPQLQTLEAYRNIEHSSEQWGKVLEVQDEQDLEDQNLNDRDLNNEDLHDEETEDKNLDNQEYYDQDLVNLLADEWRNDWLFPALASAPALKVLHLDVTDLHTPASLKGVPGPLDWTTSMPSLATYYRDEVFAYASEGAFEDCWNRVQIPLSLAVKEVYLHLRATDMRRYGIGLLHALTQLGLDLPAGAPRLRRVGMVVKENNGEQDTGVVWREMAGLFRGKGIVLWRVGA